MLTLLILVAVYITLGFMLAWIVGLVANEEIQISTGVVILVITGIIGVGAAFGLRAAAPDLAPIVMPVVNFLVLTLMIQAFTKIGWKYSAIVAVIYAVVLTVLLMGMRSCLAAA